MAQDRKAGEDDPGRTHNQKVAENDEAKDVEQKELDPMAELEQKYDAAVEEAKQLYDRFLRVSAEFENYKKRQAREMAEFRKFANEGVLKELLSVVDNLERAVQSAKDEKTDGKSIIEGVEMVLNEMLKILEKSGTHPIKSIGKPFDPSFHQAVFQEESNDHPDNTVISEIQKGYLLNDRLLRPAMVVVSKSAAVTEGNDSQTPTQDQ